MVEKRHKPIPEKKIKGVENIKNLIKENRTFLIASIKGLPSRQFQEIRKKLRQEATIIVSKKSTVVRAIDKSQKDSLNDVKKLIHEDVALMFSNIDAFELAAKLSENKVAAAAKPGQITEEDIVVEEGPTELMPGLAISELGALGIKIAIEAGKISIKERKVLVKKGEKVSADAASILIKLEIKPILIGFEPLAAFDSKENKVYVGIKVDKEATLKELKSSYGMALALAVSLAYPAKESLSFILAKAVMHEKAIENLINSGKIDNQENSQGGQE